MDIGNIIISPESVSHTKSDLGIMPLFMKTISKLFQKGLSFQNGTKVMRLEKENNPEAVKHAVGHTGWKHH